MENVINTTDIVLQSGASVNPLLESKLFIGGLPQVLATFNNVVINVPAPRDEKNHCGDKYMKLVPEHYLIIDDGIDKTLAHIPQHYIRCDFLIPSAAAPGKKHCAINRHFYVLPESLGQKIIASVEVLKNHNGTISVNILEKGKKSELASDFSIAMRPVKLNEKESPTLFFIEGTDKCLEFINLKR